MRTRCWIIACLAFGLLTQAASAKQPKPHAAGKHPKPQHSSKYKPKKPKKVKH